MGGNLLIGLGIFLIVAGIMFKFGLFSWFGHLPGDFRYEGDDFAFYFPFASMLLLSLLISILLWIVHR